MKKTTLAVPAGSRWAEAFAAEAASSGRSIAALALDIVGAKGEAKTGTRSGAPAEAGADDPEVVSGNESGTAGSSAAIPWNPMSFASARAALVEAETALGGSLDELVIFADPERDGARLAERSPREIESASLAWAAGYAELVREAARRFAERGAGTIVVAVIHAERSALGALAEGALSGLSEGLLAEAAGKAGPVRYVAYRDESGQPEALARQVVRSLDEPARDTGRLQRFGGRSGLFGRA